MSSRPGFSSEIDNFLLTEAKIDQLEEWQRFVVLIIDEMKVKEDLVYDKTGEVLLGFVDLGDINNQLHELELQANSVKPHESIATHMLTLMIRGLFIKLEFPYASFSTQGVTGEMLYFIMWEAVRRLEFIGLKVLVFVCDGAKPNQKFFSLMGMDEKTDKEVSHGIVYKTINCHCRERHVFFMSDVCHLIKTTRNCWFSSKTSGSRYMWRNGKHILWEHLRYLQTYTQAESGLFIGTRLTHEHINLTSYSKMKVNLAAQVLSSSVSSAFELTGMNEFTETSKFCKMFNKFFDCMNTRAKGVGSQKRNSDLDPYTSGEDARLKWLEDEFLGYLDKWDEMVDEREGYTDVEKKKMTLSSETLNGLRMTVHSFVEVTRYLLKQKEGLYLYSERFNQDPLESFFGQQRARGGHNDNPNVATFIHNEKAIRMQRTMVIGHGGNVRKRKKQWNTDIADLSRPLKKRPCKSLKFTS